MIPRKTDLAYFSIVGLKKAGLLEWDDKFGRRYTLENGEFWISQVREDAIPLAVSRGMGDIGITRISYLAEFLGEIPELGSSGKNVTLLDSYDICPQYILPVSSTRGLNPIDPFLTPVQKGTTIIARDLLPPGDKRSLGCYSVPGALESGIGYYGLCRISPKKEETFRGDIGEDGYPYERLKKRGILAFSRIEEKTGETLTIDPFMDIPVLIVNSQTRDIVDNYVRQIGTGIRRIGNTARAYDWEKTDGVYRSSVVKTRSSDREIESQLETDLKENLLVIDREKNASRLLTPKTLEFLYYKTQRDDSNELQIAKSYKARVKRVSSSKSLRKEISEAVKQGYQNIAIIGPEEIGKSVVSIKDTETRRQREVPFESVLDFLLEGKQEKGTVLIQEEGTPLSERRLARPGREYCSRTGTVGIETSYKDVPELVMRGLVARGVTGYDILVDYLCGEGLLDDLVEPGEFNKIAALEGLPLEIELLGVLDCKICLAEPENTEDLLEKYGVTPREARDTIVTPYEGIARTLWPEKEIIKTIGTTEVFPYSVLDVVSTGETLRRNNKRIVAEILDSQAVVVYNTEMVGKNGSSRERYS